MCLSVSLLLKTAIGCDIIDISQQKDVLGTMYQMEPEGVDCAIDAAAFRYTKGLLHTIEHAIDLETDSSDAVNEALRAVRKFGSVALVVDYAAITNQFLIDALMEKGSTLRGTGQAPVQKYWKELLMKVENGEFNPTFIVSHRFSIEELSELYDAFDRKAHGIMKTFMQTRFSGKPAKDTPELSSFRLGDLKPSVVAI